MANQLSKEEFKTKYIEEITFDLPIQYYLKKQNKFIELNFVKLKDYFKFNTYVNCLLYNYKNISKDANIVKLSYLDYMFYLLMQQRQGKITQFLDDDKQKINYEYNALFMLCLILEMVTNYKKENIYFINGKNNKLNLGLGLNEIYTHVEKQTITSRKVVNDVVDEKEEISIDKVGNDFNIGDFIETKYDYDVIIDSNDFENIRRIILFMNLSNYDGKYKSDEILEDEEIERKLKNKGEGEQTLDRLITAVSYDYPKYSREDIYNLPITRFNRMLEFSESKTNTLILRKASLSGFVSFKGNIPSYLTEPVEKEISVESFKNKLQQ